MSRRTTVAEVYNDFIQMVEVRDSQYPQFNNRNLVTFIDDSEMRANSYTPDRESQGKESWQSNFFHPTTRNKLKAIIAAASQQLPDTKIVAIKSNDVVDVKRAEITKKLVDFSYIGTNPELENFFDVWAACSHGTVIKYDGYIRSKQKRKIITSYDPTTGDVEFETKEVITKDGCVEAQVPLTEFFIKDIYCYDIQKQPSVIWARVLNKEDFLFEFGGYPKAKSIKPSSGILDDETRKTLFAPMWEKYAGENKFHVIQRYCISEDSYQIVVNGILILNSPLLWGQNKKKYPFAKAIFEPFAGKEFFYGNSHPNSLMGEQDVINSLYNMAVDKTYRSLVKPLLIGTVNQDAFDLEDDIITHSTKIPVEDVTQVKEMDIQGVNQSDMEMIALVSKGLDLSSVDQVQQGVSGSGSTAREIVIANENAKRLRSIFFMFLNDLWRQKTELRITNILMHYTAPNIDSALGEKGSAEFRKFMIPTKKLGNGEKGFTQISIAQNQSQLPSPAMLSAEEEAAQRGGVNMERIAITADYLKNYEYSVTVETNSLYRQSIAEKQALFQEKIQIMATIFPDVLQNNKDTAFEEFAEAYNIDMEKYNLNPPAPPEGAGVPGMTEQQMLPANQASQMQQNGMTPKSVPAMNPGAPTVNNKAVPALIDGLAKKK